MSSPVASTPTSRLVPPYLTSSGRKVSSGTQSTSRNPLSLRIYKVLGANFDDPSTREAFETLAEYYPPERPSGVVAKPESSKPLSGVDSDSDADDDADPWAVKWPAKDKAISAVMPEVGTTAARARQTLQRDVESILADEGQKFLKAFAEVDKVCVPRLGVFCSTLNIA